MRGPVLGVLMPFRIVASGMKWISRRSVGGVLKQVLVKEMQRSRRMARRERRMVDIGDGLLWKKENVEFADSCTKIMFKAPGN